MRITSPDAKQLQRLLPGLPLEALEELAASARQVTYRAGETIMGEHERWSPAVVADGTLRLTIRSNDGREATLRLVGRGVTLGLVAMFEPEYAPVVHERSMVAVETSTLIFFDAQTLMRMCRHYCGFVIYLLRQTVEWGGALVDAAGQFAFMSVRQRVAGYLLSVATPQPSGGLVAPITQQQLANAIGSVREVVARTLHDLRSDGLVSVSRAHVAILDRDGLMRTAFDVT
ncbi:MAG TPA: Crp/Fnr family transcriptional regulator [Candidatus Dormibacteraeota bacterium]|nr:Crp/Fnr family transcriptional regulator [Candidatus Dormibacteraeota bacterium]